MQLSTKATRNKNILKRSEAYSPRLYTLPKLPKPSIPLRAINCQRINDPTYEIAKYTYLTQLKPKVLYQGFRPLKREN